MQMVTNAGLTVIVITLALAGCVGNGVAPPQTSCPSPALSEEAITQIVTNDIKRRGRSFDPKTGKISVSRDGCNYLFAYRAVRERPGAHWTYVIDEDGKVVEILPGL
jgi:hypothetical protein